MSASGTEIECSSDSDVMLITYMTEISAVSLLRIETK